MQGRTGAGKSAIIKRIETEKGEKNVSLLSLKSISMNFLSNSDIISFLNKKKANLYLIFQIMWEHILISEYIKLKYDEKRKLRIWLDNITQKGKARNAVFAYLKYYEDKFFLDSDENIRQTFSSQKIKGKADSSIHIAKMLYAFMEIQICKVKTATRSETYRNEDSSYLFSI